MFKNITLYKLDSTCAVNFADLEDALAAGTFVPCGPTQEKSSGWVPPRGQAHGALGEVVSGQLILKLQTETRTVPADAIDREVRRQAANIETDTGRKPGKKETRDLKDEVRLSLLPHAFSKLASSLVWIDTEGHTVVVEASSQSHADAVVTHLVQSIEGLALQLVNTMTSPTHAMAEWLLDGTSPHGFSVDRACELKASDESKAVVRYANHRLDLPEIREHIRFGKLPTKLALTWTDRVSFVLTDNLQLKGIQFLEVVFENRDPAVDNFDADVTLATAELSQLITDLVDALGGEPIPVALP